MPEKWLHYRKTTLVISICISLAAGYLPIGYHFSIHRTLSFLPFFVMGYYSVDIDLYKYLAKIPLCFAAGILLLFFVIYIVLMIDNYSFVLHCPYIVLYYSDDKKVNGTNYREFALIRLDGESWNMDSSADNKIFVYKDQDFRDWDAWKKKNKEGVDCEVTIAMEGNLITVFTDENGLKIKNVTTINGSYPCAYVAITGDQVALTNIHITRKEEQVPVAF